MATKTVTAPTEYANPIESKEENEVRIRIILPILEDSGDGVSVDQYEHLSISNESGDYNVRIKRGEYVDVTEPVFTLLKQRYPKL